MPKSKSKNKKKNNSFGIRKEKERLRQQEIRQAEHNYRRSLERDNYMEYGGGSIVKEIIEVMTKGGIKL